MTDKTLFVVRGLPGSGKSTLGNLIAGSFCFAADDYFDEFYEGKFIPSRLRDAHSYCQSNVETAMARGIETIAVANTFTEEWEMAAYFKLARENNYTIHSIIVENRHGNSSIHNVPESTINKMKTRFKIKL